MNDKNIPSGKKLPNEKNMILSIDASDPEIVRLTLINGKKNLAHIFHCERNISEQLIPEIQKFFQKQKIKLSELKKIQTQPGPGHFSRLRTILATANALNYGLWTGQRVLVAHYDQAPNITLKKALTWQHFQID